MIRKIKFHSKANQKPPRRFWNASKGFNDIRLSHIIEAALALALLGTATAQVFVYLRQASIMEGQLHAARDTLNEMDASRRPWVTLEGNSIVVDEPLVFDEMGAHLRLRGVYKNGGNSVATAITTMGDKLMVRPWIPNGLNSPERINDYMFSFLGQDKCSERWGRLLTSIGGNLLLPGGTMEWLPQKFETPKNDFVFYPNGKVSLWIVICIFYRDDTNGVHATPLAIMGPHFIDPTGKIDNARFGIRAGGEKAY